MRVLLKLLLLIAVLAYSAVAQSSVKVGSAAPVFSGASIDGGFYDLEQMRGKVVLLTFWSTKCEICRHEIPKLNEMLVRYADRNVEMLGLSMDNEDKLNNYLKGNPFRFHILADSFGVVLQYADRDKHGNIDMGFPAYFLIDADGTVVYRGNGWDQIPQITSRLDKMLAPAAQPAR